MSVAGGTGVYPAAQVAEAAAFFLDNGYVRLRGVFGAEELAEMREEAAAQLVAEPRGPAQDYDRREMYDGRMVQMRVDWPITKRQANEALLAATAHPTVRGFLYAIYQRPLLGMDSMVFKHPEGGPRVGMHSLRHHVRERNLATPAENCNIGLYLDGATRETGCLQVIPGSHLMDAELVDRISVQQFDADGIVDIPAEAGDVVVHTEFVIHGSPETGPSSNPRRVLYVSHSQPPAEPAGRSDKLALEMRRMLVADERRARAAYARGETPRPIPIAPAWRGLVDGVDAELLAGFVGDTKGTAWRTVVGAQS